MADLALPQIKEKAALDSRSSLAFLKIISEKQTFTVHTPFEYPRGPKHQIAAALRHS
jgi:hypothetical protein